MTRKIFVIAAAVTLVSAAYAELQNVSVGGQIRIRARYWENMYTDNPLEVRIPDFFLPNRPIGPFGAASRYAFDEKTNNRAWVEQTTKLKFSADFTEYVNAVIELDDFEVWGRDDFRSDYRTGVDARANSSNDVEVLQAYIETNEMFGRPLTLRIGRQQIKLGNGWLVGETQSTIELSFDGVRAIYTGDGYTIDGWWTKLAERGSTEEDGDTDFYGLSASCTALEGHEFLAYWLYIRDAASLNDTNFVAPIEWLEDVFNLDNYDPTELHTVGLRASGKIAMFDYAAEAAYQFGDADSVGTLFKPTSFLYGDTDAEFDGWAGEVTLGYTLEEVFWTPRLWVSGLYFSGEDNRDISFFEWVNPFDRPEASVSFNRLFSSIRYYEVFDEGRNGSNFNMIRAGIDLHPTESILTTVEVAKVGVNEPFDHPVMVTAGNWRIPVAPALSFWTQEADDDIGYIAAVTLEYQYSEELLFRLLAQHLFTDDNVDEGNFVFANGLEFLGGSDDDDTTYFAFESKLKF